MTYEQNYQELEQIVAKLQQEDLDIDESIALFKRGIELQKICNEILQQAENAVVEILNEANQKEVFLHEKDLQE